MKKTSELLKTPSKPMELPKSKVTVYDPDKKLDRMKKIIKNQTPIWKNAGRKSKKTPQRIRAILEQVSIGYPADVACARTNVLYKVFCEWMRADKELKEAYECALLAAESLWVNPIIEGAAQHNIDDCKYLLEKRIGHKYSSRLQLDPLQQHEGQSDPTAQLIEYITGEIKGDRRKNNSRA